MAIYQKIPPLPHNMPLVDPRTGAPTIEFQRYWQQLFQNAEFTLGEVDGKVPLTRRINTTAPIAGGGSLENDLTLSHDNSGVAAGTYGDATNVPQFDVDAKGHITGVTEVPISGGGGTAPVIVQMATIRGDGTVTLPGAVTVGNWLVWIAAGHWNSIQGANYLPAGFTRFGSFNTSVNNGGFLATRPVLAGTPNSYAVTAADNEAGVLYEFSGVAGFQTLNGGAVPFTGLNWGFPVLNSPGATSVRLVFLEQDLANDWSVTAQSGLIVDFNTTDGNNHKSMYLRLSGAFDNFAEGSVATAVSDPVFGAFAIYG